MNIKIYKMVKKLLKSKQKTKGNINSCTPYMKAVLHVYNIDAHI